MSEYDWDRIVPNEVFFSLKIDVNVFPVLEIFGEVRHGLRKLSQ